MRKQAIEQAENRFVKKEARGASESFHTGDTLRVHSKVREGDKERVQVFEGVCIRKKLGGIAGTFTVRKVSYGVGVERVFPIFSPRIEKIERVSSGEVSRSRLFFLRKLQGKKARLKAREESAAD